MKEFALIHKFVSDQEAEVMGRSGGLPAEDADVIARVCSGESTEDERQRVAILMRDREDAMLLFVSLVAQEAPTGEDVAVGDGEV
jgi:hypothetical protein